MHIGGYHNNICKLLTAIQTTYTKIEELGFKHNNILMNLLTAPLSTNNQVSKGFIQRKKHVWETRRDMTTNELPNFFDSFDRSPEARE